MKTFDISLTQDFDQRLATREQELCAVLQAHERVQSASAGDQDGVTDFKDLANEQSLAAVDGAEAEQAAVELEQVLGARRRLLDHSYGRCLDCGEAIDLRRLVAVPASAFCTSCQARHETTTPARIAH